MAYGSHIEWLNEIMLLKSGVAMNVLENVLKTTYCLLREDTLSRFDETFS